MSVHTRIYWLDMPHSERLPALSAARWAALLRDKRAAALPTAFALESLAAAGLAICCLPLLVAGSPVELGFGLALTGLAIPLILVLSSLLAEAAVDRAVLTQAFVWLNSASAAGSAGTAAAAAWAVGTFGAHGGFAAAAMATGVMAVLAAAGLRALRVPRRHAAAAQHSAVPNEPPRLSG